MIRPAFLDRFPATPPRLMRVLSIAAVVAQAGIAVTGSVVRVTGSGLGCPEWPNCFPGSLTPDSRFDVAPLHQWVEFSNRMLTGVVSAVTIACLLAALLATHRQRLVRLSVAMLGGVAAQAVLGGITVLLGLSWWSVAPHFLVSMVLVWVAVLLARTAGDAMDPDPTPTAPVLPRAARALLLLCIATLSAVLIAGTLVTSAGPHAGDAKTPRLELPVPALAQLHGDLLIGFLGLLVGFGFLLGAVGASARVYRRYWVLVAVVLAQGLLGAVQYVLGVPEVLVSLHVLGACLVTAAAAALWAVTNPRTAQPGMPSGRTTPQEAPATATA
ncbi:COX15/CtaA family protein [Pseudonocardia spinosispora]|uniref:COX15/CtaA family protein n=1 Tax=Pseudonocardia spinosispora TaxID=103441 RepID=UPI0003FE70C7|nr:COX15/CtaA family protein [Pseudonocardia spinosispora]